MIVLTLEPGEAEKLAAGRADPAAPLRDADRPGAVPAAGVLGAGLPRGRGGAAERAGRRGGAAAAPARAGDGRRPARRPGADRRRRARRRSRSRRARPLVRDARGRRTRSRRTSGARARPSRAARALDHKLGGPPEERRYTAPSYEIGDFALPGFHPVEAYEAAIANVAPELMRRPKPDSVEELLAWARRAARDRRGRTRSWAATRRGARRARARRAADPVRRRLLLEALKHARVVLVAAQLVADRRSATARTRARSGTTASTRRCPPSPAARRGAPRSRRGSPGGSGRASGPATCRARRSRGSRRSTGITTRITVAFALSTDFSSR